jgi:hypothetical protein
MAEQRVRGTTLHGDEPQRLELSDGSRLMLDATSEKNRSEWRRLGRRHSNLSVSDAVELAGDEYAGYVATRTRAEVEWLRAVADWYRQQADRLQGQLADAEA